MGEKESFLAPKEIKDKYHVSNTTLQRWEKQGKIVCRKTPGGIRRYRAEDISKIFGEPAEDALIQAKNRQDICYARVSSDHQRGDLERQAEYLKGKYPTALFIKDVGSGAQLEQTWLQEAFGARPSTKGLNTCGCPPRPTVPFCLRTRGVVP